MKQLIVGIPLFLLYSCGKTYHCKGVVYSKHNVPVPNVEVSLEVYNSSKITKYYKATSDQNGQYLINQYFAKDRTYKFKCKNDSGSYHSESLNWNQLGGVDIHLH